MVMFTLLWNLTIRINMARTVDFEYRTTDTESSAEATKFLLGARKFFLKVKLTET